MTNVTTNTNDIDATIKSFVEAMGSGKSATKHLSTLVHDCANAGNTGPLSSAINKLDKKGDVSGSRVVRQIFRTIFTDAEAKMSKDKSSIILSITRGEDKKVKFDADALDRLASAADKGLSIRDALVKRVKNLDKVETPMDTKMLNLVKAAKKGDMSKAAALAMFSAQWDASEKVN